MTGNDSIAERCFDGTILAMKAHEKNKRLADSTAVYLRQIGRKAQKGIEPNDRTYDRKLDEKLKRMRPEDVDALFRGEDD